METVASLSALAFLNEAEAMRVMLQHVAKLERFNSEILERSSDLTRRIRHQGAGRGVEAFLSTYQLNTNEGVALMCLAEALLRIPDTATADTLIRDTLEGRDWKRYARSADSWLVNFSSWGLLLSGTLIEYGQDTEAGLRHTLKTMAARMGEPLIREALKKAMGFLGSQFVLGEMVESALQHAKPYAKRGYRFSYDILGEGARSEMQARDYVAAYQEGIVHIGASIPAGTALFDAPGISVKLSALHPRYQLTKIGQLKSELLPRLKDILLRAKEAGIAVTLDAEESSRLDVGLLLFEALLHDPAFEGWNGIGVVVQAYQKRAFYLIDWLAEKARAHGRVIPIRLVKGAYWDSEIKWAQMAGLPDYPVFTRKEHTDVSYLACADKLLQHGALFYPQFATHNARTVASILTLAESYGCTRGSFELQRLHGMGEALHDQLLNEAPSRIYAPVGTHKELLAYLIRRLLENGANSSFVHLLMDPALSVEAILADPIALAQSHGGQSNPDIPLPGALFGAARRNSGGMDFGNLAQLNALTHAVEIWQAQLSQAPRDATPAALESALSAAEAYFPQWGATDVNARAEILERAADLLEAHRDELVALCCREAGKTLADAVSEVREAADFCRYYAAEARRIFTPQLLPGPVGESNILSLHPRGVFACISPWNFPLAIFIGQVAAALVAGNSVIAKPAEQTPCIAARAVAILHAAGVPPDALQLVPGTGETIGAALVADRRIAGVVFTGGIKTAQHIARSLAARDGPLVPFIAETGGQNCMVVDSSALIEQAVDDILLSAFGSAGQRCSALRVLFVQEEIADALLGLLRGAIDTLNIGMPEQVETDIGPVIDADAHTTLKAHIDHMQKTATLIARAPAPSDTPGFFIAPHVFEIRSLAELPQEVFGPVLHVIRFAQGDFPRVIDAINSTGYGLTFGVHSRVPEHIALLTSHIRAGNIYVNRSMIGAVVGVQPFGGEGLSGTGPKAGGPHYLLRFVAERTTTINTAAIGGNVALLAGR
jgi:RHH-type proline utilization regulon transcriptional repressor/proline dehydrogenase/delta 1-pyrroline-5-carboxylate dehydrogenase